MLASLVLRHNKLFRGAIMITFETLFSLLHSPDLAVLRKELILEHRIRIFSLAIGRTLGFLDQSCLFCLHMLCELGNRSLMTFVKLCSLLLCLLRKAAFLLCEALCQII